MGSVGDAVAMPTLEGYAGVESEGICVGESVAREGTFVGVSGDGPVVGVSELIKLLGTDVLEGAGVGDPIGN